MKDTILSLSGGLDSSSLLFEYKDRIKLAVSFAYGSNHEKQELAAAELVAQKANVEHKIINISNVFQGISSALLAGSEQVPQDCYNKDTIRNLVVPFRNGIFLSILAAIAESEKLEYIALASHAGDHAIYPDCTEAFSDAMNEAIKLGTTNNVKFFRPYINLTKREVAIRGINAGLNPDWTYSCYKGGKIPCGKCPTCIERAEALKGLKW